MTALTIMASLVLGTLAAPSGEKCDKVPGTIATFVEKDPGLQKHFDGAAGYAVFWSVGKGGIGIGGAHGSGCVYAKGGKVLGETKLTQVTVGLQLGGQEFAQVIFFKTAEALEDFTGGNFEFNAQVSAVAVTAGASADAGYSQGVMVFTMAKGGLMYEASVGGQKFSFKPIDG